MFPATRRGVLGALSGRCHISSCLFRKKAHLSFNTKCHSHLNATQSSRVADASPSMRGAPFEAAAVKPFYPQFTLFRAMGSAESDPGPSSLRVAPRLNYSEGQSSLGSHKETLPYGMEASAAYILFNLPGMVCSVKEITHIPSCAVKTAMFHTLARPHDKHDVTATTDHSLCSLSCVTFRELQLDSPLTAALY